MNSNASGSQNFGNRGARNARSSSGEADAPGFRTTAASGRSLHFSEATGMTAASATAGCPINADSSATELIHSPPDLMRSFARS